MPWWNRRRRPADTPAARVAAVQPLDQDWPRIANRTRAPWQERARFFTENLGLVRFANGLTSQTAARCDIRVEKLVDPVRREWEPAEGEPAISDILASYTGPDSDSMRDLIARHVWHYQGTGECFQVVDQDASGQLTWSIRSTRAVEFRSGIALVKDLPGGSVRDGTARELPIEQVRRLWVPDDEWVLHAKSPMRGVLSDCERYWALARRIRREAESVLTNGLLFTPEYAHEQARPTVTPGDRPPSKFDQDYYAIAQSAFTDDDSVAAIAPLSTHYGQRDTQRDPMPPQFIYPGRMLDPAGISYRAEAVEAIARGLDLPMSLVTEGPGGGNHWSAWLVDEKFFTTHLAPIMDRVTHTDLTDSFLRPVLTELARLGFWDGDPRLYRVGYDAAPVIVHPDRATASINLYGQGLLKAAVVLEANGFEQSDQPDDMELAKIVEVMKAIHSSSAAQPAGGGGELPGDQLMASGPGEARQLPPAPALAALAPYACETTSWLD